MRIRKMSKKIRDLDVAVDDIKKQLDEKDKPGRLAPIALFVISLLLLFVSGLLIYFFAYNKDLKFLSEYLSYVCPSMAALFAGVGLFRRDDRFWYVFSGVWVYVGALAYLYTKPGFVVVILVFSLFFGFLYAGFIIVSSIHDDGDFLKAFEFRSVWAAFARDAIVIIGYLILMGLSVGVSLNAPPEGKSRYDCQPAGAGYKSGDLICISLDGD